MAHSYAEEIAIQCPHCGKGFSNDVWLIVDAYERPDLAKKILEDKLHNIICPYCGQVAGRMNVPLLLYRPWASLSLAYSPAQGTAIEQQREHLGALMERLRRLLGKAWEARWEREGVQSVPRSLLPTLVGAALETAMHQLLQHELPEGDPKASGESERLSQEIMSFTRRLQTVLEFVDAETWPESRQIVEQHPELLSEETDDHLGRLITQALAENNEDSARVFRVHQSLLRRCRAMGIKDAFRQQMNERVLLEALLSPEDLARQPLAIRKSVSELINLLAARGVKILTYQHLLWAMANRPSGFESEVRESLAPNLLTLVNADSKNLSELSRILSKLEQPAALENASRRVELYQQALTIVTREHNEDVWAFLQLGLGNSLLRASGDRSSNIEQAIAAYHQSLKVWQRESMPNPVTWAGIVGNLGIAYFYRVEGNRAENVELAIESFGHALEVYTPQSAPVDWARTVHNLSNAYRERARGDRAENIERAIELCEQALTVRTRQHRPKEWAATMNNLAAAYLNRIRGNQVDNVELAITTCKEALEVLSQDTTPLEWAEAMTNLGAAYFKRDLGDRPDNLEQAIDALESALRVRTRENQPFEWVEVMPNLAPCYYHRGQGNREKNIERAIEVCEQVLEEEVLASSPVAQALVLLNLGSIYYGRVRGERLTNISQAIKSYQRACEIFCSSDLTYFCRQSAQAVGDLHFIERQDCQSAHASYSQAIRAAEVLYRSSFTPVGQKVAIEESVTLYDHMVDVCLHLQDDERYVRDALIYAEAGRARAFTDQMAQADFAPPLRMPSETLGREQELITQLRQIEHSLAAAGSNDKLQHQLASWHKSVKDELEQIWDILIQEEPAAKDYVSLRRPRIPTWDDFMHLTRHLGSDAALVELCVKRQDCSLCST